MKKRRIFTSIISVVLFAAILAGCNETPQKKVQYDLKSSAVSIPSATLAQNDKYKLDWNDECKCVLLQSLENGRIWSNIPYEYFTEGGSSVNVNSTLNITVVNSGTLAWDTIRGASAAAEDGRIFSKRIENGIRVLYCFDNYKISVPVEYVLRNDSVEVTVDCDSIIEGGEYLVVSVSVAPFLCAVQNASSGGYLFIPSGSGALMPVAETVDGKRRYTGEVYGTDASRRLPEILVDEEKIRLPVFGCSDGTDALLGIIEKGAESAEISAEAGNARNGYSNVYASFYIRGYDIFATEYSAFKNEDLTRVSVYRSQKDVSVGFYPLSGKDADYNGMAKRYRKYLEDRGLLKSNPSAKPSYALTVMGGVKTTENYVGIKKKTVKPLTTFSETKQIVSELYDKSGVKPVVRLLGFGNGGINTGGIAGGFNFASVLGVSKQTDLEKYCKSKDILLFTDFDLINYSESGGGFSYSGSAAETALNFTAEQSPVRIPTRDYNTDLSYRLLRRGLIGDVLEKVLKFAKEKDISGLSFSSLGKTAYSDYRDNKYAVKGNTEKDVKSFIERTHKSKHKVAVSEANAYAACAADVIYDVPLSNGGNFVFSQSIPFYQMVFCGFKPMYSSAKNLSAEPKKQLMLTASAGCGISFALIGEYKTEYSETATGNLYGAVYSDNRADILDTSKNGDYAEYAENVLGNSIESYEFLDKNITRTTFSNGAQVYANHSDKKQSTAYGEFLPYGIKTMVKEVPN